jgi:hypothetical protein
MNEVQGGALPQAGWYADPDGDSERLRFWDGQRWTDQYRTTGTEYLVKGALGPPLPLDAMRNWAVAGLVLIALADAFSIVANLSRISLDQTFLDGGLITVDDVNRADSLDTAAGIALLAGYIVAAATFITWFRRAYGNVARLGFRKLRYGPGWAIGGWFVPILNIWRPKQIANDIYRASTPGLPPATKFWETQPVSTLLGWWWGLYLVSGLGGRFAFSVHSDNFQAQSAVQAIRDEKDALVFACIATAVSIAGAIVAIKLVLDLTERQREAVRARELEQATV